MVLNPHVKEQLGWIESCYDRVCWNDFFQLGELIDYYQNDIHIEAFYSA